MQYDPRLKKAMSEIKDILGKYDIAGSIVLHSPGFGEHYLKIDPSYSCAHFENQVDGSTAIRMKATKEDYDGSEKHRNQAIENTTNMFGIMSELVGRQALMNIEMMDLLKSKFDITETDRGETNDISQNK